ncbi:hypothetical protein BJY04DRAFT_212200 [Aspergillus karnatakaensis]|uniref:Zn(II)2Cys6 transcription factor n=1 Tax=Aspergillus karnatakaensis TaxID=1810916 RepID=UPI003CCE2144
MAQNSPNSEEIDRVLRQKRRQRESKACYPCRQRKVKCDGSNPCRTCVRRDHPQICVYKVEPPRNNNRRTTSSEIHNPREDHPSPVPSSPRISENANVDSSSYVFSGDNSLVSILRQQDPNGSMAREATSVLGLHNTYLSYPFLDLKTPEDRWAALVDILPKRDEVLKYFHFYRCAYPFNPILVDIDDFESDICEYLGAYSSGEVRDKTKISDRWTSGKAVGQISLLLATLAAGAHYSDLDNPQRSEVCQDFSRRSFQALRLANFLLRPSLEVVQSLLILGNTLQNNGQSDAAWALLGTTVRLAQTLGIHTTRGISHWPDNMKLKAKSLWSMTVWQDSLLSLCYDRPPIVSNRGWSPDALLSTEPGLSYTSLMHYLCWTALSVMDVNMNERADSELGHNITLLAELDRTYDRAQEHLQRRDKCRNLQQHLEHLALRMHVSFCVSALCRPAIRSSQIVDDPRYMTLRTRARQSLVESSQAFLDFQALSIVPLRTWSMVHTVLSSTLLLCTWQETRDDPQCKDVQQKVIEVFSVGNSNDGTGSRPSDYSQWLSARHIRALITLRQTLRKHSIPITQQRTLSQQCSDPVPGQQPATEQGMMNMGDLPLYNDMLMGLDYGSVRTRFSVLPPG